MPLVGNPSVYRYFLQVAIARLTATNKADQSKLDKFRTMLVCRIIAWAKRLFALANKLQSDELPPQSILSDPRLAEKIRRSCAVAREAGYGKWLWIDSCCIDKTSSSELSEAINFMYVWYKHSAVCFAFLPDVSGEDELAAEKSEFRRSRWFTRGWTLQELIAPHVVVFLSKDWGPIGTKSTLASTIASITHISEPVLNHTQDVKDASVAMRMAWASQRVTTREEDEAYSLMGIFGVNIPALYGEGRYAFIRLQEEILKQECDQSLFAWNHFAYVDDSETCCFSRRVEHLRPSATGGINVGRVLVQNPGSLGIIDTEAITATSPADFTASFDTIALTPHQLEDRLGIPVPSPTYTPSPFGMQTHLPLISFDSHLAPGGPDVALIGKRQWYLAVLACASLLPGDDRHLLAVICSLPLPPERGGIKATCERNQNRIPILTGGIYCEDTTGRRSHNRFRPVILSPSDIDALRDSIRIEEVYIPMQPPRDVVTAGHKLKRALATLPDKPPVHNGSFSDAICKITVKIRLAPWCMSLLGAQGYTVEDAELVSPAPDDSPMCRFSVTKDGEGVIVECCSTIQIEPRRVVVLTPDDIAERRASIRLVEVDISMRPSYMPGVAASPQSEEGAAALTSNLDSDDVHPIPVDYPARDAPVNVEIVRDSLTRPGLQHIPDALPRHGHTAAARVRAQERAGRRRARAAIPAAQAHRPSARGGDRSAPPRGRADVPHPDLDTGAPEVLGTLENSERGLAAHGARVRRWRTDARRAFHAGAPRGGHVHAGRGAYGVERGSRSCDHVSGRYEVVVLGWWSHIGVCAR